MHYSVDEQCQILFGTNATFCSDMEVQSTAVLKDMFFPPAFEHRTSIDKYCQYMSICIYTIYKSNYNINVLDFWKKSYSYKSPEVKSTAS